MISLFIAALLLSQAAAISDGNALERVKSVALDWRICTLDAARRRAITSDELPQAVVAGAMADCDTAYNSLRASVSIPTNDQDANIPEPWLTQEREAWRVRLTDRIPTVRQNQKHCANRQTEPRCKRLLAP